MATILGDGGNNTNTVAGGTSDFFDMFGGSDVVNAGGGNDSLYGGGNGDTLSGGTGNDYIDGGGSSDSLMGDAGDDTLVGGGRSNSVDSLDGGSGNDVLYGGNGSDFLFGGTDNDTLYGGLGDDQLSGGAGFDYAAFGQSTVGVNVTLTATGGTATGEGTDALTSIEGVIGGFGNDTITGNDAANHLVGGAGNDNISGGLGNDTIEGGLGNDVMAGGTGGIDTASFRGATTGVNVNLTTGTATGEGTDTLSGFENVTGSFFNDTITGDSLSNVLDGAEGNDRIIAGGGEDTVSGGIGNDVLDGGTGNDVIYGGPDTGTPGSGAPVSLDFNWTLAAGDEVSLAGGVSQDTGGINVSVSFNPGMSDATFSVESTNSTLGGADNYPIYVGGGETFNPGSSAELTRSGRGAPTLVDVDFSAVPGSGFQGEVQSVQFRISDIDVGQFIDSVTIRAYDADGNEVPVTLTELSAALSTSGNTVTAGGGGTEPNTLSGSVLVTIPGPVARIEISYTDLDDSFQYIRLSDIHFQALPIVDNDSIVGGDGNDSIYGGIGNDTIDGGNNDDRISGGTGNDSISGGIGADSIDGGTGDDTIVFGPGNDTVLGGDGNDFIDDSIGGVQTGDNLLSGGGGNDTIWAGDGDDTVNGDAGNDDLMGDGGNDTIDGGTGNDSIYGGTGADSLNGGADRDFVYGGDDEDTIVGGAGTDSLYGGADNDTFVLNTGDTFNDTITHEIIDGGGSLVGDTIPGDFDTIDLTAYGWERVVILPSGPEAGTIYIYTDATETVLLGTIQYTEIEEIIPCFTPGTMILTDRGDVAVEALRAGDMVMTRDNGLQPLRWVGQRKLSALDLQADPDLQPVRIVKGALSGAGPDRTMLVSPQHRVLIEGARAELLFGEAEVLVPAKHLVGLADVSRAMPAEGVTYIHILFDRHEIVQSDGLWTESFQPAERMLSAMDEAVRAEVLALFPQLEQGSDAFEGARLSLKAHEARVLFAAE